MKYIPGFVLLLAILMSVTYSTEGKTNCDTLGINLYEKIGCAKQNSGGDCPSFSDCKYERLPGKCLYNGTVFENGQSIGADQYVGCNIVNCTCLAPKNQKGIFLCDLDQCELLGLPPHPNCYVEYELNDCCGTPRCEPSKASCEYAGKTYREGENFRAKDECSECICTSEFNGKFEGPHCKRLGCAAETIYSAAIEANCAPIYVVTRESDLLCCPLKFVCPSNEDKYTGTSNSELTCKYGDQTVKSGVTITKIDNNYGKNRTVTCECKLPPLLACTMEY